MSYQSHSFSIDDAIASAQETYDLDFPSWGWRQENPLKPNDNVRFPAPGQAAISSTLAGLSIGPKSTVDRCWVTYDRQKNLQVPANSDLNQQTNDPRFLSLGTPLLYAQATVRGQLSLTEGEAYAMQRGLLYIFAYGDGSTLDGPALHTGERGLTTIAPVNFTNQFGVTGLWPNSVDDPSFEAPYLHVVLNLRAGLDLFSPPTKRFPLNRTLKLPVNVGNPHTRVAMVPIFGRKNVRVTMVSKGDAPLLPRVCDFFVGLIRNVNESNVTGVNSTTPVCEVPEASALAVPANEVPVEFKIDNPCADYIVLYATTTVGNTDVVYTISAED